MPSLFQDDRPEFRGREDDHIIERGSGTNNIGSVIVCWVARMGASGVVLDLKDTYVRTKEGPSSPGPEGWNLLDGIRLQ